MNPDPAAPPPPARDGLREAWRRVLNYTMHYPECPCTYKSYQTLDDADCVCGLNDAIRAALTDGQAGERTDPDPEGTRIGLEQLARGKTVEYEELRREYGAPDPRDEALRAAEEALAWALDTLGHPSIPGQWTGEVQRYYDAEAALARLRAARGGEGT